MLRSRLLRARSSRLVLLLAVIALLGVLPQPGSAAEEGQLVISGQGGTTVDVRIDSRPAVVDPRATVQGGRSYAGALVEPLDVEGAPIRLGAVVVRAFEDQTSDAMGSFGFGELGAGTYRVTLLGEGPVRVAWTLRDSDAGVSVTPTRALPVRFLGRAEPLAQGRTAGRVDLPAALPAGRRALQVALLSGEAAGDLRVCATRDASCPGQSLPACLPSPVPCRSAYAPESYVQPQDDASVVVRVHGSEPTARALRWSFDGYRSAPDRLRAAAIIF